MQRFLQLPQRLTTRILRVQSMDVQQILFIHKQFVSDIRNLFFNFTFLVYLENIQYIQRGGGDTIGRSACNYNQVRSTHQHDPKGQQLDIYYCTDHSRSEYLYKHIGFQLTIREDIFDKWIHALYVVIDEAKNLNESAKRNRYYLN